MTRIVSKPSNLSQRNGWTNSAMPKTRFSMNDRTTSSPRLKSFPAETIKRMDRSPMRNPMESVESHQPQAGQGDALHGRQLSQEISIPRPNICSISEQQVPRDFGPLENHGNLSELAIPSSRMENSCLEQRQHRPFVPKNNSPRKFQPRVGESPRICQGLVSRASEGETGPIEQRDPWQIENDSLRTTSRDVEKFPPVESNVQENQNAFQGISNYQGQLDQRSGVYWNDDPRSSKRFVEKTGMTSPQDVAIDQIKNYRRSIRHDNCLCQSHQADNQIYDNHRNTRPFGIIERPESSTRNWQQGFQQRQQNEPSSQVRQRPPEVNEKKQSLRFTPAMIRDQELLVTTMRQQGIDEEIMRRQFDGLLAEQRKQLLYLEQLEKFGTKDSEKSQQGRRVQRRISKIEEDGKPEWMLHITPPRIPYSVIEQIQAESQNRQKTVNFVEDFASREMENRVPHENCQYYANETVPWQGQNSYVCKNSENEIYNTALQHRCHGYPVCDKPEQMPQESFQVRENYQQKNPCDQRIKDVGSSSLSSLRVYKNVIKRQKQNNGLQDPETIKEAMEALKNPANRRGLEYLENLDKNREKHVTLNGAQEPHEGASLLGGPERYVYRPTIKTPSANGLENSRNPNNPPPPRGILKPEKIKEIQFSEYPRQRTHFPSKDCYNSMPEKENSSVTFSNNHQQPHFPGHVHPQMGHRVEDSMPIDYYQNTQPRYCTQQMQLAYGNQQQEFNCPRANSNLQEPKTIGGLKYLARKPEYSPNIKKHTIPCQ